MLDRAAEPTSFVVDLRDRDAVGRSLDEVVALLGPVDVLVNHAGMGSKAEPSLDIRLVNLDPSELESPAADDSKKGMAAGKATPLGRSG